MGRQERESRADVNAMGPTLAFKKLKAIVVATMLFSQMTFLAELIKCV